MKTIEKCDVRESNQMIYNSKGIDNRFLKIVEIISIVERD